jgi:hypothetical protein
MKGNIFFYSSSRSHSDNWMLTYGYNLSPDQYSLTPDQYNLTPDQNKLTSVKYNLTLD